ncbi:hypothetical protein C8R45DRAFT_634412 [Mycena sanguinolenta]|nr:hypothetical protein C8R45DRAFT_634412 [Mycena sanguinolenta]
MQPHVRSLKQPLLSHQVATNSMVMKVGLVLLTLIFFFGLFRSGRTSYVESAPIMRYAGSPSCIFPFLLPFVRAFLY